MTQFILAQPATPRVNSIIEQVQELTPLELVILIQAIAQLLAQTFNPFRSKTLEELQIEHGSKIMADISQAKADFWPQDEAAFTLGEHLVAGLQDIVVGKTTAVTTQAELKQHLDSIFVAD